MSDTLAPEPFSKELEELISRKMEEAKVPGLSIGIIRNAEPVWMRGFGVRSAASREPVALDTVFSVQSLSKPVFAHAALKLLEKGVLDLDTSLNTYLSQPYLPAEPRLSLVTMRHVLSHTTGFPNWRPRGKPLKVLFPPGQRFSYSGEGFVYLQKVVEHLKGKPLDDYMQENVFKPFGMSRSTYLQKEATPTTVESHDREGRACGYQIRPEANAAASLNTTVEDYSRFLVQILRPERSDEFRLTEKTIAEMLTPQVSVYFAISWGLGWGIQHTSSGNTFWQWGQGGTEQGGGYQAFVEFSKEQGYGIIILTNSANGMRICEEIITKAIGGEHPAFSDYLNL